MDIIKQEYEDYWNVSEVEREICRVKYIALSSDS